MTSSQSPLGEYIAQQAPRRVPLGRRYRLEIERGLRFGMLDRKRGRGVSRCRTPWGAAIMLARWRNKPARPV